MGRGHARLRRMSTIAPRVVPVRLRLKPSVMQILDDWFENTLESGKRTFSVEVANQGPGLLWWEAQWVDPYTADPRSGLWFVDGKLLLVGEGTTEAPGTQSLSLELSVRLTGTGAIYASNNLELELAVALL
jgi:hypothetical protein